MIWATASTSSGPASQARVAREDNGREVSLARLGAGEYVGEMALLNQTTRNATVRCVEPLAALSIHKREFALLAANLPAMRESFERVMSPRTQATKATLVGAVGTS